VLAGFGCLAAAAAISPLLSLPVKSARAGNNGRSGDVVLGSPDAQIVMIEYFSLSCPHCAEFHKTVFPDLQRTYVDTGNVRFIFRDFPLSWPALEAAILLHCAESTRFGKLQSALFKTAREWNVAKTSLTALAKIGEEHGVERARFKRCVNDGALERQILESYRFANEELGVTGTPTFFINGEKHVGGMSFETLTDTFDAILNSDA